MDKPTDFNDLATVVSPDAVSQQLNKVLNALDKPDTYTAADAWPDPVLPGQVPVPEIPASILPGWLGDMAGAVAASTQTPPAVAVMVALAVVATVLQRRFEVSPFDDDYTEPLALWTLITQPPGARKSAVFSAMTAPLVRWERLEYDRGKAERGKAMARRKVAEKAIERLVQEAAKAKNDTERADITAAIQREKDMMPAEPRAPRLFTENITPERLQALLAEQGERMAVLSDEAEILAIMAGVYSGGIAMLDTFLKGHAGTPLRVDRAGREAHVDRPALSFGLALQPGVLAEVAASRRFRDSGLLARFLYAMPASSVGKRAVRQRVAVPAAVRDEYEAALFRLLLDRPQVPGKPRVLPMTPPALEVWADFAQDIEDEQGEGGRYESISD